MVSRFRLKSATIIMNSEDLADLKIFVSPQDTCTVLEWPRPVLEWPST